MARQSEQNAGIAKDAVAIGPVLSPPLNYAPYAGGVYRVAMGLEQLDRPGPHGTADTQIFQFDREFEAYRDNTLAVREERFEEHVASEPDFQAVEGAFVRWCLAGLVRDCPAGFALTSSGGRHRLACRLTDDTLVFDEDYRLADTPAYRNALDALACQMSEDIAVVAVRPGGPDRLVAVHVTAPSHWDPSAKLSQSFEAIHDPVPGMGSIRTKAGSVAQVLVLSGPFRRYGWSVQCDDRLDHHPKPPAGIDDFESDWTGKTFDPGNPRLYVRVERQTLSALRGVSAFVFTIRIYLYDAAQLAVEQRRALASAIRSMPPGTRAYKGIADSADAMAAWLEGRA